jgi:ankyrin repeat protein
MASPKRKTPILTNILTKEEKEKNENRANKFFQAIEGKDLKSVEKILEEDPKIAIDALATTGDHPVGLASSYDLIDIVKALLKHVEKHEKLLNTSVKQYIELTDSSKVTPLLQACAFGGPRCLQELLKLGANPNVEDSAENSPLLLTARLGCYECAEILINEKRTNINKRNKAGETAIAIFKECSIEAEKKESNRIAQLLEKRIKKEISKKAIDALYLSEKSKNNEIEI